MSVSLLTQFHICVVRRLRAQKGKSCKKEKGKALYAALKAPYHGNRACRVNARAFTQRTRGLQTGGRVGGVIDLMR